MQQRLAVASVLVLALLAGASAILIQTHAYGQSSPNAPSQPQNNHVSATNAGTNSTSSNPGSLLASGNHTLTSGDDGIETELETETQSGNSTTYDP